MAELMAELTAEVMVGLMTKLMAELMAELMAGRMTELTTELMAEQMGELTAELTTELMAELTTEIMTEMMAEPIKARMTDLLTELMAELTTELTAELTTEVRTAAHRGRVPRDDGGGRTVGVAFNAEDRAPLHPLLLERLGEVGSHCNVHWIDTAYIILMVPTQGRCDDLSSVRIQTDFRPHCACAKKSVFPIASSS